MFQRKPEGNGGRPAGGENGSQTATPKQVSFLISLGARNKLTYADLVRVAQERFQVPDLYQLTKQAASQ